MKRVACPHCGFLNFSLGAACARCDRPVGRYGDAYTQDATERLVLRARALLNVQAHADVSEDAYVISDMKRMGFAWAVNVVLAVSLGLAIVLLDGMIVMTLRKMAGHAEVLDAMFSAASVYRAWLLTSVMVFAISVWCEIKLGGNPGDLVMHLRVIRASGEEMPLKSWCVRAVLGWFSALFLGAGYYMAILDPLHRTFHDRIMGTLVVKR